jgi:hypothetical protein
LKKFILTDEDLKKLLLVTSVSRGLKIVIDDEGIIDETSNGVKRETSQTNIEQFKNDEIRR